METRRRTFLVYGLLLLVWAIVVAWQFEEHRVTREAAKTDLRRSSKAIANTIGAFIRGLQFRGAVFPDRLEPALNELINGSTNELVKSSELISIALLNAAGDRLASAGRRLDLSQADILQGGEHWGARNVVMVYPVEGATVLPSFKELTNAYPEGFRGRFQRRESRGENPGSTNAAAETAATNVPATNAPDVHQDRPRRPFWARGLTENDYEDLIKTHELHGLVLAVSTENLRAITQRDLWQRCIICFFAGISALGLGMAWRNISKSSELQIRLVRASELNTHLKEMNLAAAGLAHETRNPLNIVRGLAQLISRQADAPPEIQAKSREIIDETDKVTAQLNEFINYSRPRELRPSAVPISGVAAEVVRALNFDIEERKVRVGVQGEPLLVEADEQMLRQVLFNLVLNAIQAAAPGGEIQIMTRHDSAAEASVDVKDNGPGVPAESRMEIFKPYYTTHQKGTGLGLAIVQQIVQAHGWEIRCLANEPKGALFRISHLKIAS